MFRAHERIIDNEILDMVLVTVLDVACIARRGLPQKRSIISRPAT